MENKTSKAQIRASRKWEEKNPERTRYLSARRAARSFVRNRATKEDMEELLEIFKKENKNSKEPD